MFDKIIAVTNRKICERPFLEQIKLVCVNHPKAIVLREKDLSENEYEKLAYEVFNICREYGVPLIIHKYKSVADKLSSDGLHLPFDAFCKTDEKYLITGTSVHSVDEAVLAEQKGADYIFAGHIFETDCKKDLKPRGTGFLREVCKSVNIPVYAIGGICVNDKKQIEEVLSCGAAGVCIMSGMMKL